ncbi:hypothetical protein NE236_42535 [Actinoallomurus purpureus]|uniref:hypothetical protein n=1 Tax=Actinoallomurus purpureus TaxID=478114 RepID=UPI0020937C3F|nr:hypothetical protein [Actinoallomurus purpureus]MCO6011648.1 hypothetical protein [Actinoallomurus purpureus]
MTTISPFTDLEKEAAELAAEYAPRRFALCWVDPEQDDGGVLYWGLQLRDGHAMVCRESKGWLGEFENAEAARRVFSRTRTVTLVWLDPPGE